MRSFAQPVPAARGLPFAGRRPGLGRACIQALLIAVPAEFLLFCLYSYPVDSGFTPDATWFGRALCTLSLVIHWPGLKVLGWLEARHSSAGAEMLAMLSIGYFDLALLVLGAILLGRWLLRRRRRAPAV